MMYTRMLLVLCGLFSNFLCMPLNGSKDLVPTTSNPQDGKKIQIDEEFKSRSGIGEPRRDQSSTSNPLAGWQNLLGNGLPTSSSQSSNPIGAMPPVMVLGMHQAILVPLNSLPGIFQNMLTGMFNTGNLQQSSNLIPNLPNVMG